MAVSRLDSEITFEGREPRSSYSAITLHRKCPQAWLYRYGMRLERAKDTPSPYLTIGRWWGLLRAVESLERGRKHDSLKFVPDTLDDADEKFSVDPKTVVTDEIFALSENRWKGMTADEKEAFESALGADLPARLHGMFTTWSAENSERFDREHPLGVEVFWKRELPRPESDLAWNLLADPESVPKMHLIGYIDELIYDRQREMVVVLDNKANKELSNANSALDDLMDSQLQLYAWGITPKLKREGLPAPRAIGFDRTRTVAPKTPLITASGSLSKSVTAYDLKTYLEWSEDDTRPSESELAGITELLPDDQRAKTLEILSEPGRVWGKVGEFFVSGAKKGQPKFGLYEVDEKVVEHLRTPVERHRWSRRTQDPVNRRMVETHLRAAVDTAQDIYMTQKRGEATGEAGRNLDRRGCTWCDFQDLCRAQIVGGPRGEYDIESYGLRVRPNKVK